MVSAWPHTRVVVHCSSTKVKSTPMLSALHATNIRVSGQVGSLPPSVPKDVLSQAGRQAGSYRGALPLWEGKSSSHALDQLIVIILNLRNQQVYHLEI